MKILILILAISFYSHARVLEIDQYPEDRLYTSADRGMRPYLAQSIYKTNTFVLTFDDGPNLKLTPIVLDTLKRHNVKAIFFVLTDHINDQNSFLIKRMLDEGHLVGSHGPNHDRSGALTEAEWKRQTKKSFLDLANWYKLAGHEFTKHYYRFPYGDYGTRTDYHHINALKDVSRELMGDNCINMVFWDVDTSDWVPGMTPNEVAQNIIAHNEGGTYIDFKKQGNTYVKVPVNLKNPPLGGVVLQHDVHEVSVNGLEIFLQYAETHGVHIPRIDEVKEFEITKNCTL